MCQRLCKSNKSILFTVMINGVFFINFVFIYLQIKAITVVKETRNSSGFKYLQHTFSALFEFKYHQYKFSAIVLLGKEYFLLSIKVKRVQCMFVISVIYLGMLHVIADVRPCWGLDYVYHLNCFLK